MTTVLLEIGLEEVPARFVEPCLNDIKSGLLKQLNHERLSLEDTYIEAFGTYRRFGFLIHNIAVKQDDINNTLEGPPIAIARSSSGEWLAPAIGFAKKCNVTVSELTVVTNKKGQQVISAEFHEIGALAITLLPTIFSQVFSTMKLPIAMVWGNNTGPFIRPVKWICAMLNDQIIQWELFGIPASNITHGHRFLSKSDDSSSGATTQIAESNEYIKKCMAVNVMVDISARKAAIKDQLLINGADIDDALLNEVTHLVEWPEVLKITFPDQFLVLPKEVLTECLKKHQKAFMITANNRLKNECFVVADSVTDKNRDQIISGNQRVILARLNDVQFFWDEDLKNNGFSNWNQKLSNIIFQEGLGSMADKVERVSHIAHTIMDQLEISKDVREIVYRAARRSKADLVSQMVNELPNLQGIMGAYYAMLFKEDPDVMLAIRDQYKPRFDGDEFPDSLPGVILSIADRLDTIVACFENKAIPTGSRDPWGIRRSIIAIMRMIVQFKLSINLELLLEDATLTLEKKIGENTAKCRTFFMPRLETVLNEKGVPADILQLITKNLLSDPYHAFKQAQILGDLKKDHPQDYQLLLETTARVNKIINDYKGQPKISDQFFELDIENEAYNSFLSLKGDSTAFLLNADDVAPTITFCETLSNYFDNVLINSENKDIADNRRSFIKSVNDYFYSFGDWLKLQK